MDLQYSEEQLLLRDSATRFFAERYDFHQRRRRPSPEGCDAEIWAAFAALGWLALPFAEENGGIGGGAVEVAVLMEPFGRALVVEPYVSTVILSGGLIEALGNAAQRARILPAIIDGTLRASLATTEPGGRYSLSMLETRAEKRGNGWALSGRKTAVLGGASADLFLVPALISDRANEIGVFLVPRQMAGLTVSAYQTIESRYAADLVLDQVNLESDARLGAVENALPAMETAIDRGISALCADAVGAMTAVHAVTVEYSKTRQQFGQTLSTFQALQHRMAHMAVACEEARGMALLAALRADFPAEARTRTMIAAKEKIGRCARYVGEQAVQLHGGIGVTDEYIAGHYLKRLKAFEALLGSTAHHRARYQALMGAPDFLARGVLGV